MSSSKIAIERLLAFDDAWGGEDVNWLTEFVIDDCACPASAGPEPDRRFIGKDNGRRGFVSLHDHDVGSECLPRNFYVHGDRDVAVWAYKRNDEFGQAMVVRGCDSFEFIGDKIRQKKAFRRCST